MVFQVDEYNTSDEMNYFTAITTFIITPIMMMAYVIIIIVFV